MPRITLPTTFDNPLLPPYEQPIPPDTIVFSDDFNRADAATLGVTPVGGLTWVPGSLSSTPVAAILSNAGGVTSAAASSNRSQALVETGGVDGVLDAVLKSSSATSTRLVVRSNSGFTGQLFLTGTSSGSNYWRLVSRVGSTDTTIASTETLVAAGAHLEATIRNHKFALAVNGAVVLENIDLAALDMSTWTKVGFGNTVVTANVVPSYWDSIGLTVPGEWSL